MGGAVKGGGSFTRLLRAETRLTVYCTAPFFRDAQNCLIRLGLWKIFQLGMYEIYLSVKFHSPSFSMLGERSNCIFSIMHIFEGMYNNRHACQEYEALGIRCRGACSLVTRRADFYLSKSNSRAPSG